MSERFAGHLEYDEALRNDRKVLNRIVFKEHRFGDAGVALDLPSFLSRLTFPTARTLGRPARFRARPTPDLFAGKNWPLACFNGLDSQTDAVCGMPYSYIRLPNRPSLATARSKSVRNALRKRLRCSGNRMRK